MTRRPARLAAAPSIALLLLWLAAAPAAALETGDLAALRERALSLVNEARQAAGLEPLEAGAPLAAAAQKHAEDMARRDYYAHASPEGETVRDRYRAEGGSEWRLVAENIATCRRCEPPPDAARVRAFQQGWMDSPPHRENILAPGLTRFGFGIAATQDRTYAVQTFAGPGRPRDLAAGETAEPLPPAELAAAALAAVNRAREREGLAPLEGSEPLDEAARRLLPDDGEGTALTRDAGDLFSLLPGEAAGRWQGLQVLAAACGGCGTEPTAADVRGFVEQWLGNPQYRPRLLEPAAGQLGFALRAYGSGRKVAVALVGEPR